MNQMQDKFTFSGLIRTGLLVLAGSLLPAWNLHAVPVVLTLDSSQSIIESETTYGGVPLDPQGPGSTSSTYSGMIVVDVNDTANPTSIQFLASMAEAAITGNWLPGLGGGVAPGDPGVAAPANIAVQAIFSPTEAAYVALRDIVLDLSSALEVVTAGEFPSNQLITYSSLTYEFNLDAIPAVGLDADMDSRDLSGDSVMNNTIDGNLANGTYSTAGNIVTLTAPIGYLIEGDLPTDFTGQLVASADLNNLYTGDFDADGDVDGYDFLIWQRGNGLSGTGIGVTDGDANGDQVVDGQDLDIWTLLYGYNAIAPAAMSTTAGVPEPATALLMGFATMLVACSAMGRRRG